MKWAWAVLFSLLLLVAGVEVAGFFLPDRIDLEREAVIEAPMETVYGRIADLEAWQDWSPILVQREDLELTTTLLGEPSGEGAQMEVRFGELLKVLFTVVEVQAPERVAFNSRSGEVDDDLLAGAGFEGWDEFDLSDAGNGATRVRWRRTSGEVEAYWMRVLDAVASKPRIAEQLEEGLVALALALGAPEPTVVDPAVRP